MKKILLILVVLVLSGAAVAPLAIRFAKTFRAEQHLQSAREAYASSAYEEAFQRLQSARNLAPDNLEVRSLMGPYAAKTRHRQALLWWLDAASEDLLDHESIREMILHAHENGSFGEVAPFLREALEKHPEDDVLRTRQLAFLQYQRKDLEAFHLARNLLMDGVINPVVRSSYLYLSFSLPQVAGKYEKETIQFLKDFAREDGPDGLTALRILLESWPMLDEPTREFVIMRLSSHPEADFLDQLNLLARKQQGYLQASAVLESAFALYANLEGEEERRVVRSDAEMDTTAEAVFAAWLNQQGFHESCVRFIDELPSEPDESLTFARIMALIQLGKFNEARQLILGTRALPQMQKLFLRIHIIEAQGTREERDELLELMVDVVDSSQVDWLETVLIARERRDLVIRMYQRLEQTLENPFPARMKLLKHYYHAGEGSALAQLIGKLDPAQLSPLPVQKSLLLYLKFIMNQEMEDARRAMETLVAEYPGIIDYRVLLALAYSLSGETSEAADLLNSFDPALLPDIRNLLVSAAFVSQANGDLVAAREHFARIDADLLLPLERALLRDLL